MQFHRHLNTLLATLIVLTATILLTLSAAAQVDFKWIADADGDWSNAANWDNLTNPLDGGVPNGATHRAIFSDAITANRVVHVDNTFMVKDIIFEATTLSYTLSGTGQLNGPPETAGTHMEIFIKNASSHTINAKLGAPHFRNILLDLEHSNAELTLNGELVRYAGTASGISLQHRNHPGTLIYAATANHLNSVSHISSGRVGIAVDDTLGTTHTGGAVSLGLTGGAVVFAHGADRSLDGGYSTNNGGTFDGSNGYDLTFAGNATLGGSGDNAWGHTSTFIGPGVLTLDGTVTFAHTMNLRTPNLSTPGKVILNGNNNATMNDGVTPRTIRFQHAIHVGIGSDLPFGIGNLELPSFWNVAPVFTAEGAARSIANNVNLNQHTLTIAGTEELTMSGLISGTGGLLKNDAGTFVLAGDNIYSGGTTINGGTLLAGHDNALGTGPVVVNGGVLALLDGVVAMNPVTFNPGSTLAGTGTLSVGGDLNAPDTLAPGLSTGTLTINLAGNTLIMSGSTTTEIEIADFNDFDILAILGDGALAGDLSVDLLGGYLPTFGTTFDVITATGGLTGMVNLTGPDGMWFGAAIVGGDTLQLTSLIPEPSSLLLLAFASLATLRRRRRS